MHTLVGSTAVGRYWLTVQPPALPPLDFLTTQTGPKEYYGAGMTPAPYGDAIVGGISGLLLLSAAIGLFAWARSRRRAAVAARAFSPDGPLEEGGGFVSGTVEFAKDEREAVRVEVDQVGKEWQRKGAWVHLWSETSRRVIARPFYLRRVNGERVRVEPGSTAQLVDTLDGVRQQTQDRRTVIAQLTPGEHAIVEGALTREVDPEGPGDYRRRSLGFVVRPRGAAPLHVSAEGLSERHLRAAKGWRRLWLLTGVGFLVCQLFFSGYWTRLVTGAPAVGVVVDRERVRAQRGHEYYVDYDVRQGRHREQVIRAQFYSYRAGVELHVIDAGWATTLGVKNSVWVVSTVGSVMVAFFAIAFGWVGRYRPWYERRLVIQEPGRLDGSR